MDDLWVINSFFNPMAYRRRLENHRVFRERLGAPLLTVELVSENGPSLSSRDADLLVRAGPGDVLWQKERLLNVALRHLPARCRMVAWVDSDILFEREDWSARTKEALREHVLIQPFSQVRHLRLGADLSTFPDDDVYRSRDSFAWQYLRGTLSFECVARGGALTFSPGHAWAMRRKELERTGFYDAAVTGGGTLLTAAAALGAFDAAVSRFRMNRRQERHFLKWANRFRDAVGGRIGTVEGTVFHLWHGETARRGYGSRFSALEPFDFDPENDIEQTADGAWRWSSEKPGLHEHLRQYFANRSEDGPGQA